MAENTNALTVTSLNEYIKRVIDADSFLSGVLVKGEISNFVYHRTGHLYFTLKDENSLIKSVMFSFSASKLKFMPENGMKVIVHGRVAAFTRDGTYNLYCDRMEPDGIGALYVAYEQLKKKLSAEGLFDVERKKPIPKFARTVGVVTSASGAALHDILNVSGRRDPSAHIIIYPSYVQGELAPQSLAGGIRFFNNVQKVDVIIIGRGGGSAEDLWCFNDEMLARTIAESEIPVISAVGHETDFTICDFVADMRAPTPSAAAELAFFDAGEVLMHVDVLSKRALSALDLKIRELEGKKERLDRDLQLRSPEKVLDDKIMRVERAKERLELLSRAKMDAAQSAFATLCARLEGVNPLAVLSRGYSVLESENGEIISSISEVEIDQNVTVRLSDGSISARVTQKNA